MLSERDLEVVPSGRAVLLEAVPAVDGAPVGRLEGDFGLLAALAARRLVHLSRSAKAAASAAAATAESTAISVCHVTQLRSACSVPTGLFSVAPDPIQKECWTAFPILAGLDGGRSGSCLKNCAFTRRKASADEETESRRRFSRRPVNRPHQRRRGEIVLPPVRGNRRRLAIMASRKTLAHARRRVSCQGGGDDALLPFSPHLNLYKHVFSWEKQEEW